MQDLMQAQADETSYLNAFAAINIKHTVTNVRELAAVMSELQDTVAQRSTKRDGEEVEGLNIVMREPMGVVLVIPPQAHVEEVSGISRVKNLSPTLIRNTLLRERCYGYVYAVWVAFHAQVWL